MYITLTNSSLRKKTDIDIHLVIPKLQRSAKVKRASVHVATLNPKCLTVGELYGEFNPTTMEWTDGLLSHIYRKFAKDSRRGAVKSPGRKAQSSTTSTPRTSARTTSSARSFSTTVSVEQSEGEVNPVFHHHSQFRNWLKCFSLFF